MTNPEGPSLAGLRAGEDQQKQKVSHSELSTYSTEALIAEALRRPEDLLDMDGRLSPAAFKLADLIGIRVCVDGIPARRGDNGEVELMAIRRNTGPCAGKLALVGGGVGRVNEDGKWVPESFEEAMKRHFRTDLGYQIELCGSWRRPDYVAQDMRPMRGEVRPGFTPNDNSRHLVAARWVVKLAGDCEPVFGSTAVGGQEASGIEWFDARSMQDSSKFGYGHHETYSALFQVASSYLGRA